MLKGHVRVFSRFVLVGLATAAIYFAVFALLHDIIGISYRIAVSIGYGIGVAFHFLTNRNLTFRDLDGKISFQLMKYSLVATLNYVITLILVQTAVEEFGLSPYLGVMAAVVTTTLMGYALFTGWVFRRANDTGSK
jgi:putative flippase GtrA